MRGVRVLAGCLSVMVAASQIGCSTPGRPPAILVLAAASLQPVFTEIGERFRIANPGADVHFDFASSPDLAIQLTQGAGADVFASADAAQMDKVTRAGLIAGVPVDFASNTLAIVTAPGNPRHIDTFADLAAPGLTVVVSPPPMPCGVAARRVEDITGVHLNAASEEEKETDVLSKVITGQADAGLVNITDALSVGDKVTTVTIPEAAHAATTYPIAVLEKAPEPELARKFVDLVAGEHGRQALARAGFGGPRPPRPSR